MVKIRVLIVACEDSGDILGSALMRDLRHPDSGKFFAAQLFKKYSSSLAVLNEEELGDAPKYQRRLDFTFAGIGGKKMMEEEMEKVDSYEEIAVIGLWESLLVVPKAIKIMKKLAEFSQSYNPDLVITIDSPGFNFQLVKKLRQQQEKRKNEGKKILIFDNIKRLARKFNLFIQKNFNFSSSSPTASNEKEYSTHNEQSYQKKEIKYIHYVAPTVWARKPQRAKHVARLFDHLLLILPFEKKYFPNISADYVGHPLVINSERDKIGNDLFSYENIANEKKREEICCEKQKNTVHNSIINQNPIHIDTYNNSAEKKIAAKEEMDLTVYSLENDKYSGYDTEEKDECFNIFGHEISEKIQNRKIISVMIGSRKNEIKNHIAVISTAISNLDEQGYKLFFAFHTTEKMQKFLEKQLDALLNRISNTSIFVTSKQNEKKFLLKKSDLAWVKSGTIVIEVAMAGVPMATFYSLSPITEFILAPQLKKHKFFNLINIVNYFSQQGEIDKNNQQLEDNPINVPFYLPEFIGRKKFTASALVNFAKQLLGGKNNVAGEEKSEIIERELYNVCYSKALNMLKSPKELAAAKSLIEKIMEWDVF